MEPAIKYRLIKKEKHTGARLGELITPHGTFPTPMFMPVGTQASVKSLAPEELDAMGAGVILSNTYHLWLRPANRERSWRVTSVYELEKGNLDRFRWVSSLLPG